MLDKSLKIKFTKELNKNRHKMPINSLSKTWDKYQYVIRQSWIVNVVSLLGLIATLLAYSSLIQTLNLNFSLFILFVILGSYFLINKVIYFLINIFYPKFQLESHVELIEEFWNENDEPTVDIFLPTCGEEVELISKTLDAIKNLNYKNYKVYVLDDKGDLSLKNLVDDYRFNYLSRPNKREYKKSGNLQYGYDNSNGKYTLVLDADFRPHVDALKETIPYLEINKRIGILQTPQYFATDKAVSKRSWVEYGAGVITEDFYRITQPARSLFGGAICVGTSAIYRRKAILQGGGSPKCHGSEDVRQGLMLKKIGYQTVFLPLVISQGICPDNLEAYFKQHNRWCSGSLELFFSDLLHGNRLGFGARMCYLSNFTYYTTEALSPLLGLHIFLLLLLYPEKLNLLNYIFYVPYIMYELFWTFKIRKSKFHLGLILAGLSNTYTYIYAISTLLFGKKLAWQATNAKTQSVSIPFIVTVNIALVVCLVYCTLLGFSFKNHGIDLLYNYNTWAMLFTCLVLISKNFLYFGSGLRYIWSK